MIDETDSAALPPLVGVVPLMRRAYAGEDLRPFGAEFLARAQANPADANAWLDFANVLFLTGNRDHALAVQAEAVRLQPLYALPAQACGPGLHLLALMGPGDFMANTPLEYLLEESDVTLQMLYLLPEAPFPETVPDHDVMIVAVGESDASQPLLRRLESYVANWPRPVLNRPDRIARLSRDGVSEALLGAPGIVTPIAVRTTREMLAEVGAGETAIASLLSDGGFPVIVRPLGSHAGIDLERLDQPADLAAYLERVHADGFYLSRFIDYRDADGLFRKYRIVLIDGQPYISHFALSDHWIIHYANAGMADSAVKRAEEARRMAEFDSGFAVRHAEALAAIHARMGLDYLIIDCAETTDGRLLVFEVDNSAVVHALDPEDLYPYKKPAMRKLFAAFRQLLEHRRQP